MPQNNSKTILWCLSCIFIVFFITEVNFEYIYLTWSCFLFQLIFFSKKNKILDIKNAFAKLCHYSKLYVTSHQFQVKLEHHIFFFSSEFSRIVLRLYKALGYIHLTNFRDTIMNFIVFGIFSTSFLCIF